MKTWKKIAASAGVLGALLGGSLLTAAPASAADLHSCPSGYSCSWKDANFTSGGSTANSVDLEFYIPNYRVGHSYGSVGANDQASSVVNNGNSESSYWYRDAYQGDYAFPLATKQSDSNLGDGSGYGKSGNNDKISSTYFASCLNSGCV